MTLSTSRELANLKAFKIYILKFDFWNNLNVYVSVITLQQQL